MTSGLTAVAGDIWLPHSLYSNLHKCNLIIICDHAFVGIFLFIKLSVYRFTRLHTGTRTLLYGTGTTATSGSAPLYPGIFSQSINLLNATPPRPPPVYLGREKCQCNRLPMSVLPAALSAPPLYKHPPVGSRSFSIIWRHLFVIYVEMHRISINLVLTFLSSLKFLLIL